MTTQNDPPSDGTYPNESKWPLSAMTDYYQARARDAAGRARDALLVRAEAMEAEAKQLREMAEEMPK
jgi:hypothetical protein